MNYTHKQQLNPSFCELEHITHVYPELLKVGSENCHDLRTTNNIWKKVITKSESNISHHIKDNIHSFQAIHYNSFTCNGIFIFMLITCFMSSPELANVYVHLYYSFLYKSNCSIHLIHLYLFVIYCIF